MILSRTGVKKLLNHKSETIFGAGLLMSGLTLLGSFMGILRNALLASRFGASASLDVYYASFRLPDLIYNIFIIGAISAAFIPLFNEYLSKDRDKAWKFASLIIFCVGCLLSIFGLAVAVFARPLLSMFLVGFSQENLQLAVLLTRIMMIQPIFLGISSVISGVLRSFRLFFVSALAPVMYNLGIIIGIVFLVPLLGLKGLAFGVVLGACLHLFIQLPSVLETGFRLRFLGFSEFTASFKRLAVIMLSRTSVIVISQFFLMGVTSIATLLKAGTITIFAFVDNILPYTIFALPFADAAFPHLSRLEAEDKQEDFLRIYRETLLQILLFLVPLAVWFIVFREPVVRLLLGYGKFDWQATSNTMKVLSILSLAMIFQGMNYYLLKVFFAKKDAQRPLAAGLIIYPLGFILCYHLALRFGIVGLAWGILGTYILYSCLLLRLLRARVQCLGDSCRDFHKTLVKIISASIASGFVGYLIFSVMSDIFSLDKVKYLLLDTGLAAIFTVISFLMLANLFQIKEIKTLQSFLSKKLYAKRIQSHS